MQGLTYALDLELLAAGKLEPNVQGDEGGNG